MIIKNEAARLHRIGSYTYPSYPQAHLSGQHSLPVGPWRSWERIGRCTKQH